MKNLVSIMLVAGLFIFTAPLLPAYDYADAFEKGVWFFDANKCGPDAGADNVFSSWRGACHTTDSAGSIDLTGGYHDAGDHVKFGLPQFWTAGVLGWIMYEYRDLLDREGLTPKLMSTIKRFTDFILKSHASPNVLYYEVGDGHSDHAYWGPPETQTNARPALKVDMTTPGTDVCGEASAALSLMYLNYRNTDSSYANRCLESAGELYDLARANMGQTTCDFYKSSSHYDDLAWAAVWLAIAKNDNSYLEPVDGYLDERNNYGDDNYNKQWAPAWDDVALFAMLKMAQLTENFKYMYGVESCLRWYGEDLQKTPGGLPWLDEWGVLRYASAEAGLGFLASKLMGINLYNTMAEKTMDYCLGSNPRNSSYITNYLNNPPRHPHHRANQPDKNASFTNGMVGALVGGPNSSDGYKDDVNDYTLNEVAIDYNASFLLGMAGMLYFKTGGAPAPSPIPPEHPSLEILYRPAEAGATSNQIKPFMKVKNPGPLPINLSEITIRYYYTKEGTGTEEFYVDWAQMGQQHITGIINEGYVEIGFLSSAPVLKIGTDTGEMQIRVVKPDWSEYNQSNDYSFNASSSNEFIVNTKITAYHNGVLIFGTEPAATVTTPPTPEPTDPPTTTPVPGSSGDVNDDGNIDIVDALLVAQYYVGLDPANFNITHADTNCDSTVDIIDALLIAQLYVGLNVQLC
ncbi:MAG: glycoside hydrolase family 9 protein [Spirochaetales bacterium]|nr:glycoside hydrolase family 9 protein [Spirochaetales bacterium]